MVQKHILHFSPNHIADQSLPFVLREARSALSLHQQPRRVVSLVWSKSGQLRVAATQLQRDQQHSRSANLLQNLGSAPCAAARPPSQQQLRRKAQ
jgi:hypothetical protein